MSVSSCPDTLREITGDAWAGSFQEVSVLKLRKTIMAMKAMRCLVWRGFSKERYSQIDPPGIG